MKRLPHLPIDEALKDHQLLGAALGPTQSWATWLAVLRAAFGLDLDKEQLRAFRRVSGDRQPPTERVRELWAIAGRRSGKSRIAAALATYLAILIDHSRKLAPGEVGYILCVSPTQRQAKLVFGYAHSFIQASPFLSQQLLSTTQDEIRLTNNIVIATHPCSFRSIRGRTVLGCIFDESSFFRDETGALPDTELYSAALPALATSDGMLIGISSPYRRVGLLFQKFRDHFGEDDAEVLVVRGATEQFNPTIDKRVIAAAMKADPVAAESEWSAQFRSDLASLLDDATIDAAINHDRPLELPPRPKLDYVAFTDASAGRHDAFTLCIGHQIGEGDDAKFIADVVRGRRAPFDPRAQAQEFAQLARNYHCRRIVGDAYAGGWVEEAFQSAGMRYELSDLPKSGLYLEALPFFMRGAVSIPDHPQLIRELRLLERRTHRSGRDTVDHGQGGSDDFANALAGAIRVSGMGRKRRRIVSGAVLIGASMDGSLVSSRSNPTQPTVSPAVSRFASMSFAERMARSDPKNRKTFAAWDRARRAGRPY